MSGCGALSAQAASSIKFERLLASNYKLACR